MWSGAISFGLVNVPVKLYSAVSKKTVRFNQLNAETGNRIPQKRVDPQTGEEVAYEHIVKGYELTKDRYVVITPEELDALDPEKTRTIDIEDFVDLDDIDPVYYDHPYYLVPDKGARRPTGCCWARCSEAGKVAIAARRAALQGAARRDPPGAGDVLMMETMIFHDEVVPRGRHRGPAGRRGAQGLRPRAEDGPAADRLALDEFEPGEATSDEYREKVLELIERKASGEEIAVQPEAPQPAKVPDLMAALEASLAAVKERRRRRRAGGERQPRPATREEERPQEKSKA